MHPPGAFVKAPGGYLLRPPYGVTTGAHTVTHMSPFSASLRELVGDPPRVPVRELARRMAKIKGTKVESERRELNRYLSGDKVPNAESMEVIREALGVDETELPTPAPSRVSAAKLVSRLEQRLDSGVQLRQEEHRVLQNAAAGVRDLLRAQVAEHEKLNEIVQLLERIEALLTHPGARERP